MSRLNPQLPPRPSIAILCAVVVASLAACTVNIPQAAAPEGDTADDASGDTVDNDGAVSDVGLSDAGATDADSPADTGLDVTTAAETATGPDATPPDATTGPDTSTTPDAALTPDTTLAPDATTAPDMSSPDVPFIDATFDAPPSTDIVQTDGQQTGDVKTGSTTCKDRCGKYTNGAKCQCDGQCTKYKDCCKDFVALCLKDCGNGKCTGVETTENCPKDCGKTPGCGDFKCDVGEDASNCSIDCSKVTGCGNGVCDQPKENPLNCGQDCGVVTDKCTAATCSPQHDACLKDKECIGAVFGEALVRCAVKANCKAETCLATSCKKQVTACDANDVCKKMRQCLATNACYEAACQQKCSPSKVWGNKLACAKSKCAKP